MNSYRCIIRRAALDEILLEHANGNSWMKYDVFKEEKVLKVYFWFINIETKLNKK